jgi:hypothetical protein
MDVRLTLTLRNGHRPRVFENRVLRGTFGNLYKLGDNCTMRSFIICSPGETLVGL